MKEYSGKNVLISGGSSGIGLALAERFISSGAHVTILARDKNKLKQTHEFLLTKQTSGQQVVDTISADVSDFDKLSRKIRSRAGQIDILINSAGSAFPGKFIDIPTEKFKQLIDVNYLGTVYLTKLIVPHMINRKQGHVVNISSLAAMIGIYGYTAYAPTKFALRGFSKCLRTELKPYGVHVSVVFPPDTDTPQLTFERSIMPEITRKINQGAGEMTAGQVADAIVYGMGRKKFYILPGIEAKMVYLLAPFLDRYFNHYAARLAKKEIS